MNKKELIDKIKQKKEFSLIPEKDLEKAFLKFDKKTYLDEEKIKFTRDFLRKIYFAFSSKKLLNLKNKNSEWFLRKHLSTKERFQYYSEIYSRILKAFPKKSIIFDLGAGINGFSYSYFKNKKIKYIAIEAVGQLVNSMNFYFKKNNFDAVAFHESLFDLEKLKKLIKKEKGFKAIFLFKTIDSLEKMERNYSKKLIKDLSNYVDIFVVSFATRSLIKKFKFKANRKWLRNFIKDNFEIIDDFVFGNENYIIFR